MSYDGAAFQNQPMFNQWLYNPRSELISSRRHAGTYVDEPNTQETDAQRRLYSYDAIGNRISRTNGLQGGGDDVLHYCTNKLNQYTATHEPGDSCPEPATPVEAFSHDEDGSLLTDGTHRYTWSDENRLVRVEPLADPPQTGDQIVDYGYDYQGRRVHKRVQTKGPNGWTDTVDEQYVYHGWNVVMVLDGDGNAIRKYTWGLDLSGQSGRSDAGGIQGAGGIGGLLSAEEIDPNPLLSTLYWFMYDANGNVTEVVQDGTTPTLAAHYEYDPYGNVVVADDVNQSGYVDTNPFRFSTKWYDPEVGTYYYGRRYLKDGRWTSKDPIGERGGVNLYGFVGNRPVDRVDPFGLDYYCGPYGSQQECFAFRNPGDPDCYKFCEGDPPGDYPKPQPPSPWIPLDYDLVELYCRQPRPGLSGGYHCDVVCTSGKDGRVVSGGGSGPSSGYEGPLAGGDPQWVPGPGVLPGGQFSGSVNAKLGSCDCISQRGEKLNKIDGKIYDLPILGVSGRNQYLSNSNALLSTLLRCCDIPLTPTDARGTPLNTPGWGKAVKYKCPCLANSWTYGIGLAPPPPPSLCRIGCRDLQ